MAVRGHQRGDILMPGVTKIIETKEKEIEQLTDLNKAKGALIKAQAKKIGQLLKEKEWVIESYAYTRNLLGREIETSNKRFKQEIIKEMQQALKE